MASRHADTLVALVVGLALAAAIVLAGRLVDVTTQIQQERYDQTYAFCKEQNARHNATVAALHTVLVAAEKKRPRQTAQIQASEAPTLLLINALVPVQDCAAVARAATH